MGLELFSWEVYPGSESGNLKQLLEHSANIGIKPVMSRRLLSKIDTNRSNRILVSEEEWNHLTRLILSWKDTPNEEYSVYPKMVSLKKLHDLGIPESELPKLLGD